MPRLVHELREWRAAAGIGEAWAVEASRRTLLVDLAGMIVVLAVGLTVFFVLRPDSRGKVAQ